MRSSVGRRLVVNVLLVTLGLMQGCHVARSAPVGELRPPGRIRLKAAEGFVIRQSSTAGATPIAACLVVRADGEFVRASGDTLFLRRVFNADPPTGAELCRGDDVAHVVLTETPALRVQTVQFSYVRTFIRFVAVPGALFGGLYLIFLQESW